jgi:hypothetical protein
VGVLVTLYDRQLIVKRVFENSVKVINYILFKEEKEEKYFFIYPLLTDINILMLSFAIGYRDRTRHVKLKCPVPDDDYPFMLIATSGRIFPHLH